MIVSLIGASIVISEGACRLELATWCQHLSLIIPEWKLRDCLTKMKTYSPFSWMTITQTTRQLTWKWVFIIKWLTIFGLILTPMHGRVIKLRHFTHVHGSFVLPLKNMSLQEFDVKMYSGTSPDDFKDTLRQDCSLNKCREGGIRPLVLSNLHSSDSCFTALMSVSRWSQSPWPRGQCLGLKGRGEPGSSRSQNTSQLSPPFLPPQHSRLCWLHPPLGTERETRTVKRKCESTVSQSYS